MAATVLSAVCSTAAAARLSVNKQRVVRQGLRAVQQRRAMSVQAAGAKGPGGLERMHMAAAVQGGSHGKSWSGSRAWP